MIAFVIFIVISFLLFAKRTVDEQQQKYKDVVIDFCEKGCTYHFPKELKPEVLSHSDKYPVVTLEFPFKGELIPVWINRKKYLRYPENHTESENDKTPYIIKESTLTDEFHKKKFQFFYTSDERKVVFRNNSFTFATEQKIEQNTNILYFVPSELSSDITTINKEINNELNSIKTINTNE